MRFILRLTSLLALLVAIIVGGLDAIRFVASDVAQLTSFETVLVFFDLDQSVVAWSGEGFAASALQAVFALSAEAVFLSVSLILWLIAYKRKAPRQSLAAPQSS